MHTPQSHDRTPLLQIRDATVVKNSNRVLDRITLTIREGEHTAVLGPNGAGKSSLIRLIAHLDYPLAHEDGTPPLLIFGEELWNVTELRSLLGIVSADLQHSILAGTLPRRTRGLDAVISGFFASYGLFRHHHFTPVMREQARQALALMEASHLADAYLEAMSPGEVRRVMIARALVSDPRALLLDEPTTGLDLMARHRFLSTLQNLARHGKTIILVTHHIEEIFPEIDRVVLLRHGRVLLDGRKSEVLTSRHLSAMFEGPVTVQASGGYYTARSSADQPGN
ncbi:MAG: ATP-binding cassette domain-containing protein [Syntrophobacterales bacterium]|jgi:iron complex transport system ATP-binding protein|nr:ATP-binding cassette domain-containing protein [Syntrophobacterales bacterium]